MDTIAQRKRIVRNLATEIAGFTPDDSQFEVVAILDDDTAHYLLYSLGWKNRYRGYGCFFHLHVRDTGKVYIENDGINLVIADLLVERGIPQQEIVLAWQAPDIRADLGFAVI